MIIDIREKDETLQEKIEHSVNLPLSDKENLEKFISLNKNNLILMCRSGKRAEMFHSQLSEENKLKCKVYKGGINEYKKNNKTLLNNKVVNLPIFRQVMITIGFFILLFSFLGILFDLNILFYILGAMSFGILFAGITGNCLMANILSKMWWNK